MRLDFRKVVEPSASIVLIRCGLLFVALLPSPLAAQRPPRWVAVLADGSRTESHNLTDWQSSDPQPKLENHLLFEAANPVVWLRDRSVVLGEVTGPFVETHTGDRLPGEVLVYRAGDENTYDLLPAYFEVKPQVEMRPPTQQEPPFIRVVASYARKIVWIPRRDRQAAKWEPRTVFLRDGGKISFRSIRFSHSSIAVLVGAELRRIPFSNIAELHLACDSWWGAYLDELAILSPDGSHRLVQIETSDGLIATASVGRFATLGQGGANEPHRWVHGWQPAWSLDVLWLSVSKVFQWRMFGPHEIPLSRLPVQRVVHRPILATESHIQVNRNAVGRYLSSSRKEFSWGFGVQSHSELSFDLHPSVHSFRSSFGIDSSMGTGGCVRFQVFVSRDRKKPIFESEVVVGSQVVGDTGIINLTGQDKTDPQLVLVVDAAHEHRPLGADPLDIRDMANWLDPMIQLDPEKLRSDLQARALTQIPAWRDWHVYSEPQGSVKRVSLREDGPANVREFRPAVAAREAPLVLHQQRELSPHDRWLALTLTRSQTTTALPKLEVCLGSELWGAFEPTLFDRAHRDVVPILIPLANRLNKPKRIDVYLRQTPDQHSVPLRWGGIQFAEYPPTLYPILHDSLPDNSAELVGQPYSGKASLRVSPGMPVTWTLARHVRIRERPGIGEFRFLRLAFKTTGEGQVGIKLARPGSEPPLVLDAGNGPLIVPDAKRVWSLGLADKWVVVTRDLFADFGPVDLTHCTFEVANADAGFLDHVFLARAQSDFDLLALDGISPAADTDEDRNARPFSIQGLFNSVVHIEFPGGRKCLGIAVGPKEIVLPGVAIAGSKLGLQIRLADGRTASGEYRGLDRSRNVALVRVTSAEELSPVAFPSEAALSLHDSVASLMDSDGKLVSVDALSLDRMTPSTITTRWPNSNWTVGAPLINSKLQVVGLAVKRGELGGLVFVRVSDVDKSLNRLRNGDVWGDWPMGCEPDLGLEVSILPDGLGVRSVVPGGPAERAGLRIGDKLVAIHNGPVETPDRLRAVLSTLDPGDDVTVEFVRDAVRGTVSATLEPRIHSGTK